MRFRAPRLLRRIVALVTWDSRDEDMTEEMRHHLDSLADELVRSGLTRAAAAAEARRRFGSVLRMKEAGHDQRRPPLVENLVRDVRFMARGLRRSPGFATTVVLTLAIGIGGNTTIFSVVDQVLLRPLPYPDGDRLLLVSTTFDNVKPAFGATRTGAPCNCVSPTDWLEWQRGNHTLDGLAFWFSNPLTLTGVGDPVRLNNQAVSSEFFPVLGVAPLLGRAITAADDAAGAPRVAVISYRLWQERFNGERAVIGRTVQMNSLPTQIVGVMPENFRFIFQDNDVWTRFPLDRTQDLRQYGRFIDTIARRKSSATLAAAQSDLAAIQAQLATKYALDKRTGVKLVSLREELTGQVETSLLVLYGAVAVLLSIACFNVANLLLVRALTRSREIAVRTSLGAGRGSIVRQLLVESLLLAAAGGTLGIALAHWSVDALAAFAPPDLLRVPQLTVDTRVLLYALGISLVTGVVCGVAPVAFVGVRPLAQSLRSGGTTVTHAPRLRQMLVGSQVALTVILLCGAGLLSRTLFALTTVEQGFDRHGVLTMEVSLPLNQYKEDQRVEFFRRAVESIQAIPGVQSAAAGNSLAIVGAPRGGTGFQRRGTPELAPGDAPVTLARVVTPGYFRMLRIPIVGGREFTHADPATAGFVVNEAFVHAYLKDAEPIGAELSVAMQRENPYLPIIGVVGDVSEGAIRNTPQPTVFYNIATMPEARMTFLIRTDRTGATAALAIDAIRRLDPKLPVTKVQTFETALGDSVARERLNAIVSVGFALSGLLLTTLGVYGLLTFIVNERTKEIAIRIALGAHVRRLTGSVVARGLRLVVIGAAIGLAGSFVLLRSLRTLLFEVTPYDVPTYGSVIALLCVVALVACYLPARSASRIEPLIALRDE